MLVSFISKCLIALGFVVKYMDVSAPFLLSLLDPVSPMVPDELRNSWVSDEEIYKWTRKFCYAMHKKRSKLIEAIVEKIN